MIKHELTTLLNKLRVLTIPMKDVPSATVLVMVNAGSRYEDLDNHGIAHFQEHMFFKGGKKYRNAKEVAEATDAMGAISNAFTGKDRVGYWIKSAAGKVEKAVDILADSLRHAAFKTKDINTERGVILEELNMYEDMPQRMVLDKFEELIFGDQPLGRDIGGTRESVRQIQRHHFIDYKDNLYTPDNIVLCVAGGVSHHKIVGLAKKYFAGLVGEKRVEFAPYVPMVAPREFVKDKKTEQTHLVVGSESYADPDERKYALSLLTEILGGSMSSRMFQTIRNKYGLAYYVQTFAEGVQDTGVFVTRLGVDNARVDLAIQAVMQEYKKAVKGSPITQGELKRAKGTVRGQLLLSFEDSSSVANFYARQESLYNKIESIGTVLKKVEAVTLEDIRAVARDLLQPTKMSLAVIGPMGKKSFSKLLKF